MSLDPEDYYQTIKSYQATCSRIVEGYEGNIAQYLGDGLLISFGYPNLHEGWLYYLYRLTRVS